jgi:hypothetical protein
MNIDIQEWNNLLVLIFKISMTFFCLLHGLFVLYIIRQVINLDNLLSTLRRLPLILFGFIHAIIFIVLIIYIIALPQ